MNPENSVNKVEPAIKNPFQRFFKIEASGGLILIFFTFIALILANSSLGHLYERFWENHLTIQIGGFKLSKTFLHWINDGLMAIFFFVVGLEIKREVLAGELSSIKQASLPIFAALGGMLVPAMIYIILDKNPETTSGWGIPMATDIAFSLGILSLLGKRVPVSLKIFLAAFAIADDLGAVVVIAIFYSADLHFNYLIIGIILFLILILFNRIQIRTIPAYMIIGWVIWYMFLKSGIHPTIAGVLIAFTIPSNRKIKTGPFRKEMDDNLGPFCPGDCNDKILLNKEQLASVDNMGQLIHNVQSPLQSLEHTLHGFVTFIIMPVFALANAGVILGNPAESSGIHPVSFNTGVALLVGKVVGILLFTYIAVKTGLALLPDKVKWKHLLGIGFLGGMGFTMSIFISNLAFSSPELLNSAKIGILAGSFFSGLIGFLILKFTLKKL